MQENRNITRWIVALPIIGIFLTAILLITIGTKLIYNVYDEELNTLKIQSLKNSKKEAIQKVERLENDFLMMKSSFTMFEKKKIEEFTLLAVSILDGFFRVKERELTKKQLIKKVTYALRDVKFYDNKSGYFFVYDKNLNCLLLPPAPYLEGKSLLKVSGENVFRRTKEFLKTNKKGFFEWKWFKPNDFKAKKKKIGYLYTYEPLGIYLGTARYEEDIDKEVKKEILRSFIKNFKDTQDRYFIYSGDGKELFNTMSNFVLSKNEINHIKGVYKLNSDGFFVSKSLNVEFKIDDAFKMNSFYVKFIPSLNWIIGTNTYDYDTIKNIEAKKSEVLLKTSNIMLDMSYVVVFSLLIISALMYLLSKKLKMVLKSYQKSILKKNQIMKKQQEKLTYQVDHDMLTSLPNRFLLSKRLELAIKQSRRDDKKLALIFIDIDKFKSINDSLGHEVVDELIKKVAKRLKESIRKQDLVARFGGDEFVVLIENFYSLHDIVTIIEKIQQSLKSSIEIFGVEHRVTLSMGVSLYPSDAKSAKEMFKNADIAMYSAKESGRNGFKFFTDEMNLKIQNQISTEKALFNALQNDEFELYYQPLYDTNRDKIYGFEALLRWNSPQKGLVGPNEFIEIAEESGLIVQIGEWVIKEAISQIYKWNEKGIKVEKVSINLAIEQLESKKVDIVKVLKKYLKQYGVSCTQIEIEVIERALMNDFCESIKKLREIRDMGIDIAVDDFGTGYSSLVYLKNLPITKLKIDREFIKNIVCSKEDKAIVKSIISLSKGLQIKILAEGVESDDQKRVLMLQGCSKMQGFYFGKPMCAKEAEKILL